MPSSSQEVIKNPTCPPGVLNNLHEYFWPEILGSFCLSSDSTHYASGACKANPMKINTIFISKACSKSRRLVCESSYLLDYTGYLKYDSYTSRQFLQVSHIRVVVPTTGGVKFTVYPLLNYSYNTKPSYFAAMLP